MNGTFDIDRLLRKNIRQLIPYSSARSEYTGRDAILLDANENPFPGRYNRYPDPLQKDLKAVIARLKDTPSSGIFLGNGSDEAIDLLVRAFCEPGKDKVISMDPSYGMYRVCADIQGVELQEVSLDSDFDLDLEAVTEAVTPSTKIVFLCSPNNPTGNILSANRVAELLERLSCLVVIDEAYQDFSTVPGFLPRLGRYPNLVVLQTFSKAWGQAGIRLGMAFASEQVITVLNRIKYPYNLNSLTIRHATRLAAREARMNNMKKEIIQGREWLRTQLADVKGVMKIYPSEANFLLVKFSEPERVIQFLRQQKIIVRDRSRAHLCEGCLRITVGTGKENKKLVKALRQIQS